MSLYQRRFGFHDVDDVEGLCVRGAARWVNLRRIRLSETDFNNLVAFLVASVWRMAERYDPERSSSFKAVVLHRLGNRCTDWIRQDRGRTRWQFSGHTYEREIPRALSFDVLVGEHGGVPGDPLVGSVGSVDGDPAAGADTDSFGGLLDDRDSEAPWDTALVRALARRLLRERSEEARAA